ncbi:MAG TPA: cell division protein ZapA [Oscillospiraceae bacterium]|nr:cell division protein ZapA [Oscillospiraceae bacterium]
MNKVKVMICGKEYSLQTDETPEYVLGLSRQLNRRIDTLVSSSDNISTNAATALVAISYMDELEKANANIDNIRTQIKDYVDEAGRARLEREEALKQVADLKIEIESLKNDIKLLSLRNDAQRISDSNQTQMEHL